MAARARGVATNDRFSNVVVGDDSFQERLADG